MRFFRFISVLIFIILGMTAAASDKKPSSVATGAGQVFLLGRDASGSSILQALPLDDIKQSLAAALSSVQDSLMAKLSNTAVAPSGPALEMRTFGVGIGLAGQIGIGPLFQITLSPKLRLVFSNSKTPVYPD